MKIIEKTTRIGLDTLEGEEVSQLEVEEAGYEFESTDSKDYAVVKTEVEVPETLDECLEVLDEETMLSALQSYIQSSEAKKAYDEAKNKLQKKVPAEVEREIATMRSLAESGFANYSPELLDNIPYEAKVSKEALIEWLTQNA